MDPYQRPDPIDFIDEMEDTCIGIPMDPWTIQSYVDWWKLKDDLVEKDKLEKKAMKKEYTDKKLELTLANSEYGVRQIQITESEGKMGERLEKKAMKKEYTDTELEAMLE